MINALITVKNTQKIEQSCDDIELISEGEYTYSKEKTLIKYKEIGPDGETKVTLGIKENEAVLIRENKVKTMMIFEPGRNYVSNYHTPFGDFNMRVITNKLKNGLTENGGELLIKYELSMGNTEEVSNTVKITVKPL